MTPQLFESGTVHPPRSISDLAAEHAEASRRINRSNTFWQGKVLRRDIPQDERAEVQRRLDDLACRMPF